MLNGAGLVCHGLGQDESSQIAKLDEETQQALIEGNAIFSASSAVKELIENSLDAGAT